MMTPSEALYEQYRSLAVRITTDNLSIPDRIKIIDHITIEYALKHAEVYEQSDQAHINYKDDILLGKLGDLILREYLKWSHPDKMSIVEYPFTSESQEEERRKRYCLVPDVIFGDRRANGKRTTSHTDEDGNVTSSKGYITIAENEEYSRADIRMIVRDALANADLTQRQKEAIYLVFYKRMTQEEAGEFLGIRKHTINEHLEIALGKLRKYLTKTPNF